MSHYQYFLISQDRIFNQRMRKNIWQICDGNVLFQKIQHESRALKRKGSRRILVKAEAVVLSSFEK